MKAQRSGSIVVRPQSMMMRFTLYQSTALFQPTSSSNRDYAAILSACRASPSASPS